MTHSKQGSFDAEMAKSYDQRNRVIEPIFQNIYFLSKALLARLPEDARILMVGVGTGNEIVEFAQAFPKFRFVAVEPSKPMIEICEARLKALGLSDRCELNLGTLDQVEHDESFDAALMFLVAHHVKSSTGERAELFSGIANRLKPNGILISAEVSHDFAKALEQPLMVGWQSMWRQSGSSEDHVQSIPEKFKSHLELRAEEHVISEINASGFKDTVQFAQSFLIRAFYAERSSDA